MLSVAFFSAFSEKVEEQEANAKKTESNAVSRPCLTKGLLKLILFMPIYRHNFSIFGNATRKKLNFFEKKCIFGV